MYIHFITTSCTIKLEASSCAWQMRCKKRGAVPLNDKSSDDSIELKIINKLDWLTIKFEMREMA